MVVYRVRATNRTGAFFQGTYEDKYEADKIHNNLYNEVTAEGGYKWGTVETKKVEIGTIRP
jgi:hypothetical protein|tara:strand:- start:155 stop:337 length:183 start_codon:yes stop_codon:yes gene_type:complete